MSKRKSLPSVNAPNFLQRLREEFHVMLGLQGPGGDRVVRLEDMVSSGVVSVGPGGSLVPGPGVVAEYEPDLTPPPQPGAFTITGAISHYLIEQEQPFYTQGRGHLRTHVYAARHVAGQPLPVFADAIPVAQFEGTIYGVPSDPSTTWRVWIKWQSVDGVLSATPAGGTNGVVATTGQDVSSLLDALAGQITSSELSTSLSTPIGQIPGMAADIAANADAIAQEAIDRAQGDAAEALARANALAQEASDRAAAIAAEAQARTDALAVEALDRAAALQAESNARAAAIGAVDSAIRADFAGADAALLLSVTNSFTAADALALAEAKAYTYSQADINSALSGLSTTLTTNFNTANAATLAAAQNYTYSKSAIDGAIAAEGSTLRADFTAADAATLASAQNFTYSRSAIDAADTATLATLRAEFAAADSTTLASAQNFTYAKATIDSAISTSASTLRSQITGGSTATDLNLLSSGLLYQMRETSAAADSALSQQIFSLQAGAGEQFDYSNIWYFDAGVEGWTANNTTSTTISAVGGWLRMVASTGTQSGRMFQSPVALAIDGAKYPQVRLRVRKVGAPTWVGRLYFITTGDSTWNTTKSVLADEPTYDANGIGLLTVNMPAGWTGATIAQVRFEASTNITTSAYFELDWVAVGRPSPGASSAQLTAEQIARQDGDNAQAVARETLASQLRGGYTGSDINALTQGLLFSEREARTSADAAEVTARQSLSTKMTGTANPGSLTLATLSSGLLYDERQARSTADATEVTARQALSAKLTGANDPASLTLATLSSGLLFEERQARVSADASQVTARETLETQLRGTYTGTDIASVSSGLIHSERQARSAADAAEVTARQALSAKLTGANDPASLTLATLSSGLIFDERQARVTAVAAEAARIDTLTSTVNNPTTGVVATANGLETVKTLVNNSTTGVTATANKAALLESRLANARDIFAETWDGTDPLSRWQSYDGAGEPSIVTVTDGVGGKALRVGNNAGNDMRWYLHRELIPFDPNKLYRMRVRVRRPNGTGTLYLGWAGVAADGVTLVNSQTGGNSYSSQHYHCASNIAPGAAWAEYTGYTKGHGATIGSNGSGTPLAPGKMHPNVRYLRVLVLVNYQAQAGITEVGPIVIDDAEVKEIEAGLNTAIAAKANQTALNELSTRVDQTEDAITLQGQDITALQGDLELVEDGLTTKADASAVNAIATRIESTTGNILTSTGSTVTALNNSISIADGKAVTAQTTANNAATAAANAQNTANTASTNATTANNLLADIASDSKLTPSEKQAVRTEWNVIAAEKAGINTQATTFGVTTENTTYNNAFQTLANYLNNGTAWSTGVPSWISDANLSTTTNIVGSTFRTNWQNLYTARTALLNRIAARAKELADAAQATANAANTLAGTKADASALNTTNTNVSNLNGVVTAQGTRVSTLEGKVDSPITGLATKASIAYVDQAEADAVSASATASQTLVSNLKIGGSNQVKNSEHPDGYGPFASTTKSLLTGQTLPDGSTGSVVRFVTTAATTVRVNRCVKNNGKHSAQMWCRATAGAAPVTLDICDRPQTLTFTPSASWSFRALEGVDVTNYSYATYHFLDISLPAGITFDVWHVQVEQGDKATGWGPSGDDLFAAVQVESSTRATQTGELYAQYTVKTDVGGLISGYGLASTANNAAPTSAFGIQAGQFFVAPPTVNQATAPSTGLYKGFVWRNSTTGLVQYWTGSAWSTTPQTLPFVVQATPTTINGVAVPAGVYMADAFVQNGTITNAKIANLAVDDAKVASLSVSKLTAGSIAVGQHIQSTGYVAGSAGWRINGDGTAEFSGVVVRGTVFATAGLIGGNTINSTGMQSPVYAVGSSGWRFDSSGALRAYHGAGANQFDLTATGTTPALKIGSALSILGNGTATFAGALSAATGTFAGSLSAATGTFAGSLSAATGTFSGELSAATGTFSGSLTADAVNAVDTINLAGNSVTIPASAYTAGGMSVPFNRWENVQSLTVTSPGGVPFLLIGGIEFSNQTNNPAFDGYLAISTEVSDAAPAFSIRGNRALCGTLTITPPAGTTTFYLKSKAATGVLTVSQRSLCVIGTKR